MERLVVLLLDNFPLLPAQYHHLAATALQAVISAAEEEEGGVGGAVVHQAILRSCSHPALSPTEGEVEPGIVSVRSFLPLWTCLLSREAGLEGLYSLMVTAVIDIVDRLDLSTVMEVEEQEEVAEDVTMELSQDLEASQGQAVAAPGRLVRARRVKDYTVLVNLTLVCLHALPLAPAHLVHWAPALWRRLALWTAEQPEVSAWYKLARLLVVQAAVSDIATEHLVSAYFTEVMDRVDGSQEELRLSCFQLLLELPVSCVEGLVGRLAEVLPSILRLGLSLLHLAAAALTSLLHWLEHLGEERLGPVLTAAMPLLATFLATDYEAVVEAGAGGGRAGGRGGRGGPQLGKLKVEEQRLGARVAHLATQLVCRVSSTYKILVLPTKEEVGEAATVWHLGCRLSVHLPLPDLQVPLHLDALLPVLAAMVEDSPDRRVRVAAAELLHVIVLVMVGRSATQTAELAASRPLAPLFTKLLPLLVRLSVDADTVLASLFSPLLDQLAHWWSRPGRGESPLAAALLDAGLEAACTGEPAVQARAAALLSEFLLWAVRQGGRQGAVASTKSLLRRLHFLWRHPQPSRRLGACAVFNRLYTVLREEKELVSVFLLETLAAVMVCIRLTKNTEVVVAEAAAASLGHIQRILLKDSYRSLFLAESEGRRVPEEVGGGTMAHLQLWLLNTSSSPHTEVRRRAMELFFLLKAAFPLDCSAAVGRHEGGVAAYLTRVVDQHAFQEGLATMGLVDAATWCNGLTATLETLTMVLQERLFPSSLVAGMEDRLMPLVTSFLDKATSVEEMDQMLPTKVASYRKAKCTTLVRLFNFLRALVTSGSPRLVERCAGPSLVSAILSAVLEPSRVGFHLRTREEVAGLEACCSGLLAAVTSRLPGLRERLEEALARDYLTSDSFRPQALASSPTGGPEEEVVRGYIMLRQSDLLNITLETNAVWEVLGSSSPARGYTRDCSVEVMELLLLCSGTEAGLLEQVEELVCAEERSSRRLVLHHWRALAKLLLPRTATVLSRSLNLPCKKQFLRLSELLIKAEGGQGEVKATVLNITVTRWGMVVAGRGEVLAHTWILHLVRHLGHLGSLGEGEEVVRWWCQLLAAPSVPMKVKQALLQLLEAVAGGGESRQEVLRAALLALASQHFPARSSELVEGSLEAAEYRATCTILLRALQATAAPSVFYLLLSVACREEEHMMEEELQQAVLSTMATVTPEHQARLLDVLWTIFVDATGQFSSLVKAATVSRFLLPALLAASVPVTITFYTGRLAALLKGVSTSPKGGEEARAVVLTERMSCLHLLAALYSRLERSLVHGPSDLTRLAAELLAAQGLVTAPKHDGKDLSTFMVRCLTEGRSLVSPDDCSKELANSYRAFHCASLNCMVAVISCIQDQEKFYDRYIFKEIHNKQELLWSRVVDEEAEMVFGMEQEEVGRRRRQLVAVRRSAVVEAASPSYLHSHYLADSSLSQDISRYDFTSSTEGRREQPVAASELSFLEVENSLVGRHPCLAPLVAVVRHMEAKAMYPVTGEVAPGWMRSVLAVLQDARTHRNALLLLLKLILSCQDTFKPFAKVFLGAILGLVASGRLAGKQVSIDYFTSDVLTMLLSWSSQSGVLPATEEGQLSARRVLAFLVRHVHHTRRDILRHNMDLVKSVLEVWRPAVEGAVDLDAVEELLLSGGEAEGSGVQVSCKDKSHSTRVGLNWEARSSFIQIKQPVQAMPSKTISSCHTNKPCFIGKWSMS